MPAPKFIDLQLSGQKIGDLVLNRARTQVFWSIDPISLVNTNDGIIDHIEFTDVNAVIPSGNNGTQTVNVTSGGNSVTAAKVQVVLDFRVFLKLISVAEDPAQPKDTYYGLAGGIPATLSLDLSLSGSPASLCVAIVDWDLASFVQPMVKNYPQLKAKILANLQAGGLSARPSIRVPSPAC